jgi:DnaJ-class molecular chaperone
MSETNEIKDGIEWSGDDGMDMGSCARCGSSASFVDCWQCGGEGFVERNIGDDVMEELIDVRCGECRGTGGRWHCISTPEYCQANPIAGREAIESTAMNSEAWRDVD